MSESICSAHRTLDPECGMCVPLWGSRLAAKDREIEALTNELRYLQKLANGLANEVIEGTEPHHKRETAFQVVAATKSALAPKEGK